MGIKSIAQGLHRVRVTREARRSVASATLARQLYKDDLSRADEVPMARDGHRAYDGWLKAASEAGDTDTIDALEVADRDEFAAEWNRLVAEADESAAERAESDE